LGTKPTTEREPNPTPFALGPKHLCLARAGCQDGRQPWGSRLSQPAAELAEHESGVWALSASAEGAAVATGTEEGCVALWDLRCSRVVWQVVQGGGDAFI
jgi:hypothetical protein